MLERMFDTVRPSPSLDGLNDPQRRAVTYEGPSLLVVAGAGSGKTKTLVCRLGHLLATGTPPERILLLTFTRRAARVMLARAARLSDRREVAGVWGGTFHSIANRLLRAHGRAVGVPAHFTVIDQADAADIMSLVRSELAPGQGKRRFPRKETLIAIYSRTVNAHTPLTDVVDRHFPWCAEEIDGVREIFKRYVERKRRQAVLDFDDLLLYWKALATAPGVAEVVAGTFDHILVDEYQDTNAMQADILRAMRAPTTSLTVVGDDAQAIYSFRAASVTNMLEFPMQHPDTHIIKLEQNYRSTEPILRASNAVIARARKRYGKELWSTRGSGRLPALVTCRDESEQSALVCDAVLERREQGTDLKRQAVLFRAGHHSAALELELTRRNIPFVKFGGLKFVESAHVKDVVCLLRVLENPWDELSWFRSLQLLEGVGPALARRVMSALGVGGVDEPGGGAASPLTRFLNDPPRVPVTALRDVDGLRSALDDCSKGGARSSPAAQIERLRGFYEPALWRLYDGPASRVADLEQLERIASGYPSRRALITDLTLDPPLSTGDLAGSPHLDEDYLVLSTIHSAKGGEWDVVNVIHAADGMIPSDMALSDDEGLEEELRLFYVAMTRARNELNVFFPLRYYRRRMGLDDAHSYAQLTRFIPEAVGDLFEKRGSGVGVGEDGPVSGAGQPSAVDELLSALWEPQ